MSEKCKICRTKLGDDLFAAVTQEPVCAICKQKFIGALPTTEAAVAAARIRLDLAPGEYLKQDNAAEARRILGR
jgi:hypothetical protein